MKKILLIICLMFLLTGCTANYELTYKKGYFTEEITIYEDKEVAKHEEFPSITNIKANSNKVKINEDSYYTIEHSTDEKNNILKATYVYKDLSFDKSLVYNDCFSEKSFVDGDESVYIYLGGEMTCEHLENATITFKTDKQVIKHNADKVKKGVYSWDSIPTDGIVIEVSKKNISKDANMIPPVIRIIIIAILLGIGIYILKKYNGVTD